MSENTPCSPVSYYAFYQLYRYFLKTPQISIKTVAERHFPEYEISEELREKKPLFITWKIKSRNGDYNLRGCIGTFARLSLLEGIEQYSLIAALEDSRFSPITYDELPRLKCSCNILKNFTVIYSNSSGGDILDWELGKHGIQLLFKHPKTNGKLSATFLPEVMPEQSWDKQDTFTNLIKKAGCWKYVDEILENYERYFTQVIRYEGEKSEITYDHFKSLLENDSDLNIER